MKLRESGMPEETYWESLFQVDVILERLRIGMQLRDCVELGCGYGTFSIPIARAISGVLHSYDVDPVMVQRTTDRARTLGVLNLVCRKWDVFEEGFDVDPGSQSGCFLFNILHGEDPVRMLKQAAKVTAKGGSIYIIHWRHDPSTPRGPSLAIRPRPADCVQWGREAGLIAKETEVIDLPPYHYGIVLSLP